MPTAVLVESLRGHSGRDADTDRFVKTCIIDSAERSDRTTRRSAAMSAHTGPAVDALVVVLAEPDGTVLTGDRAGIEALAAHATRVAVEVV